MQVRSTIRLALLLTLAAPVACKTDKLKPEAANVAAGRSAERQFHFPADDNYIAPSWEC